MNVEQYNIKEAIVMAVRESNLQKAWEMVQLWRDLEEITKQSQEVRKRQEEVERRVAAAQGGNGWKGRRIAIEVTRGSRKYSYLLVSKALREGTLSESERLKIHVPATGERFETSIFLRNKHLAERKAVGRFYEKAAVVPGDFILLEEVAASEWSLTKCVGPGPAAVPAVPT